MALTDLIALGIQKGGQRDEITKERIDAIIPIARRYIAFWREYPDIFIEFLSKHHQAEEGKKFELYFYQRCFLRAAMRHRKVYATFPRGYSKSFLSFLVLMIRCVLYPGSHLFVTTGGKELKASSALE